MKCIFLAAIINWIQAVRQFNTSKPWEYCTYCRSVKSTYSPAKELNIDFGGNTEELVFSHRIQHPVYKHIVHYNHSNVVVVHQITEVIETKNILKYSHMHVSYSKQVLVQSFIAWLSVFWTFHSARQPFTNTLSTQLKWHTKQDQIIVHSHICVMNRKSSAGTQEQGC